MSTRPASHAHALASTAPRGTRDGTHLSEKGAALTADLMAAGLRVAVPELATAFKN